MFYNINTTFEKSTVERLNKSLKQARKLNNIDLQNRVLALLWWGRDKLSCREIAAGLGVSHSTIAHWTRRFLIGRFAWLRKYCFKCGPLQPPKKRRARKETRGRKPNLTNRQKARLKKIVSDETPEKYGFRSACWDAGVIAVLIEKLFKATYSPEYLPQFLRKMGLSYQKAKFVGVKVVDDEDLKNERRKWDSETWPGIVRAAKREDGVIVFSDEVGFRMWGSLYYTWAPKGGRPLVKTKGRRKNLKYFGGIELFEGRFHYLECEDKFNGETYVGFLKRIVRAYRRRIFLIDDGAPYHKSSVVSDYVDGVDRLTVERLPAYSPDKNPIERLWRNTKKDATHLKYFASLEELRHEVITTFEEYLSDRSKVFCVMQKMRAEALC